MIIKSMETEEEIRGKAYVHWKAWQETGELYTLYVLVDYYDQGIGYQLIQGALKKMQIYERISLWVLEGNVRAISFYEKVDFRFDGVSKTVNLGADRTEYRMVLRREA
ncbi:GNAT family N-acetyltransferase [Streptococcus suis]|nr:GNAT family N-acetyltransferase [Streptococcus suis]